MSDQEIGGSISSFEDNAPGSIVKRHVACAPRDASVSVFLAFSRVGEEALDERSRLARAPVTALTP